MYLESLFSLTAPFNYEHPGYFAYDNFEFSPKNLEEFKYLLTPFVNPLPSFEEVARIWRVVTILTTWCRQLLNKVLECFLSVIECFLSINDMQKPDSPILFDDDDVDLEEIGQNGLEQLFSHPIDYLKFRTQVLTVMGRGMALKNSSKIDPEKHGLVLIYNNYNFKSFFQIKIRKFIQRKKKLLQGHSHQKLFSAVKKFLKLRDDSKTLIQFVSADLEEQGIKLTPDLVGLISEIDTFWGAVHYADDAKSDQARRIFESFHDEFDLNLRAGMAVFDAIVDLYVKRFLEENPHMDDEEYLPALRTIALGIAIKLTWDEAVWNSDFIPFIHPYMGGCNHKNMEIAFLQNIDWNVSTSELFEEIDEEKEDWRAEVAKFGLF